MTLGYSERGNLHDPASGRDCDRQLDISRNWHTATLLPTAVLVAGGSGD